MTQDLFFPSVRCQLGLTPQTELQEPYAQGGGKSVAWCVFLLRDCSRPAPVQAPHPQPPTSTPSPPPPPSMDQEVVNYAGVNLQRYSSRLYSHDVLVVINSLLQGYYDNKHGLSKSVQVTG